MIPVTIGHVAGGMIFTGLALYVTTRSSLPGDPTVDTLAREAWQAISRSLPSGIVLERVVIKETPTCSVEISRDGV